MDVLFLSVSTGAGHFKAAEALKEAVENRYPFSRNFIVDSLKYINPVVDKLVVGGYLTTVRVNPVIYQKLYEFSEVNENLFLFSKAINNIFSYKLKSLISDTSPSVVVCTHPFPLQMLSILKRKNVIRVPVVAVLTDFVTHNFWVHEHVDAYVVATESMRQQMIARGVQTKSVFSYGIPVSESFIEKKSRKELQKELGLKDNTTVLVMGGSLGLGSMEKTVDSLLSLDRDLQIIVITGDNYKVRKRLQAFSTCIGKEIRIIGYTDRVSDYMDVSDFLITKPGGMTISEALVKELPTILVSPIPGQEEGNAGFLAGRGAVLKVDKIENLSSQLNQLLNSRTKIQQLKKAAKLLVKPNASRDILGLLERLSQNKL